jgi:hypothetical protein
VPALALIVHQHPEEAQTERNGREPVPQVAQQRAPDGQPLAVRPRDAHAHEQLSRRLAKQHPEDDRIADGDSDTDERGHHDDDIAERAGLDNSFPDQAIQGEEAQQRLQERNRRHHGHAHHDDVEHKGNSAADEARVRVCCVRVCCLNCQPVHRDITSTSTAGWGAYPPPPSPALCLSSLAVR